MISANRVVYILLNYSYNKTVEYFTIPFSLSDADRKLVVMVSFSDVVYLLRIPARLLDHVSNDSSQSLAIDDTDDIEPDLDLFRWKIYTPVLRKKLA